MDNFNERIVVSRQKKGLTQRELAHRLQISPTRLNYWEKGKREPDVQMIKRLSELLEVSTDFLIGSNYNSEKTPLSDNAESVAKTPEILNKYNSLNTLGKQKADEYITDLSEQPKYTEK